MNILSKMFLWIYDRSTQERFDASKRKLSLKQLIARAERRMKVKPECPFGHGLMTFRTSHVVDGSPCRDDIAYKCTTCFHTLHFGIPISRETVLEEIELRGSHQILQPTAFKLKKSDPELRKRLVDLGYIDF